MSEEQHAEAGLIASAKRFAHTMHEFITGRLELFLIELHEERIRVVEALLLVACGLFCAAMSLLLATVTLVVVFWEHHAVVVLLGLIGAYAAGAGAAFLTLRKRLQKWQAFSATLDQIKKDRKCLEQEPT